jgi:hypothetical protein
MQLPHTRCCSGTTLNIAAAAWTTHLYTIASNRSSGHRTFIPQHSGLQDDYIQKALPGRLQHQPPPPRAHQPFQGESTYANTYKAHAMTAQKPVLPQTQACALILTSGLQSALPHTFAGLKHEVVHADNTGRFDAKTTYVSDYPGHQPPARDPMPTATARPHLKFEATSHYHDEYPAKSPEPRAMGHLRLDERPRIPFDASSEYAQTYHAHELPQRIQYQAPPPRAQVPFDGTSTSKDTYVQHPIEPRCENYCSARTAYFGNTTFVSKP